MIRLATRNDLHWLQSHDHHIASGEMTTLISLERVLMACEGNEPVGWLRWNLFWDNTPFMNMLYVLEPYRKQGWGQRLVTYWETLVRGQGFTRVLTSTRSDEDAQHFYRKQGYREAGVLLLPGEAEELIFCKEMDA